jgi:hypothetical protein
LNVSVPPGGTGWTRPVAVYDSSNSLVATGTVTVPVPTVSFQLPAGMYTVTVGGTLSPGWSTWPTTLPANTTNKYRNTALTSPGVVAGGTYNLSALAAN